MSDVTEKLEERSRELFKHSVENLDMRVRSRLTQARFAALQASARPSVLKRFGWWTPAAGVTAAAVLGVTLWLGGQHGVSSADGPSDMADMFASADDSDMLQDDIDFYEFADKADGDPAA